jgi:hypothetical protein
MATQVPQQTDRRWHLPAASRDQPANLYHCKVNVDFRSVPVFAADVSFGAVQWQRRSDDNPANPERDLQCLRQEAFRSAD